MVDSLAERGRSHTRLRELLDARDPLLHAPERELLLDAADALLFDEPDAEQKLADARMLLTELVESGRWVQGPADEVLQALEGCRAQRLVS
jgi:hypothetical protein